MCVRYGGGSVWLYCWPMSHDQEKQCIVTQSLCLVFCIIIACGSIISQGHSIKLLGHYLIDSDWSSVQISIIVLFTILLQAPT